MFYPNTRRSYLRMLAELILLAIAIFALGSLLGRSQDKGPTQAGTKLGISTTSNDDPLLRDYKGVTLGMTAEEARRKLGEPSDKGDQQDFYNSSETEAAQIFYDAAGKVIAISVHYFGERAVAPNPKAIFGAEAETRADGSVYKLIKYVRAGYWVSYNRTAGDQPIVTVSMKRDAP
jgi:hypothetical protein